MNKSDRDTLSMA